MRELQRHVEQLIHTVPANKTEARSFRLVLLVLSWFALLALVLACMRAPLVANAFSGLAQTKSNESPAIRLVLQTSKKTYRVGEPVEITAYLQNLSRDKFYYVGNELGGFVTIASFHHILLSVIDEKGREVPMGHGASTEIWPLGTTISEKLARAYTQLGPGMIYGLKASDVLTLQPGRYRLRVSYLETEALSWTEAERKALQMPIWTQPLVSTTVAITVLPPSSTRRHPDQALQLQRAWRGASSEPPTLPGAIDSARKALDADPCKSLFSKGNGLDKLNELVEKKGSKWATLVCLNL